MKFKLALLAIAICCFLGFSRYNIDQTGKVLYTMKVKVNDSIVAMYGTLTYTKDHTKFKYGTAATPVNPNPIREVVVKDRINGTLYQYIEKNYRSVDHVILERPKEVTWRKVHERVNIAGHLCEKAIGIIDGEEFVAWYAPALPSIGPWKAYGCPGLVLKGYFKNNNDVFFTSTYVKTPHQRHSVISILNPDREDAQKSKKQFYLGIKEIDRTNNNLK